MAVTAVRLIMYAKWGLASVIYCVKKWDFVIVVIAPLQDKAGDNIFVFVACFLE
jgi:hypothetical protein